MAEFEYTVTHPEGLSGSEARQLAAWTDELDSYITVQLGERSAPVSSLYSLLTLNARTGDTLHIVAEGENAQADVLRLQSYLKTHI